MNDRICRVGRIHLRVKRRNFYGKINDREQLRIFAKRICPAAGFATEMLEQLQTTTGVLVRFLFAYDCLAEKIDRKPDALGAAFAEHFHDVLRIPSGDELARHAGYVPSQELAADPRDNFCRANSGSNQWRVAVAHVREIFVEMLDDIGSAMERRENIDKAEQLHLEVLIAHRERHHSLVKAGFTEERLRMLVDQIEYAFAASFDFGLQSAHNQKVIARQSEVKAKELRNGQKIQEGYGHLEGELRSEV